MYCQGNFPPKKNKITCYRCPLIRDIYLNQRRVFFRDAFPILDSFALGFFENRILEMDLTKQEIDWWNLYNKVARRFEVLLYSEDEEDNVCKDDWVWASLDRLAFREVPFKFLSEIFDPSINIS